MNTRCFGLGLALLGASCAHDELSQQRSDLAGWRPPREAAPPEPPRAEATADVWQGDLRHFVGQALRRAPEVAAAHARWQAALARAEGSAPLPEPQLGYTAFIRAVETRVGPQRHRISLRQAFPWPGQLRAERKASVARASTEAEAFRSMVLDVVHEVAVAYWQLWVVERSHAIRLDHERILEGLVDTVQARVETGEKSIAELLQVQLRLETLRDHRTEHRSRRRATAARLLAAVGAEPGPAPRTLPDAPSLRPAPADRAALRARLREHPRVRRWSQVEASRQAEARAARRDGFPSFVVGADYIITGAARAPGVEDDGKDPIGLAFGLSLPVWRGAVQAEVDSAEAEAAAARAEGEGAWLHALAQLERILARLDETQERVQRYERTLIPQAEALEASVRAAYEVQRATVASVLLALEDELRLRLELAEARAEHATAWAELEQLLGAALEPEEVAS